MKLQDLVEMQKVIDDKVKVSPTTTKLDYKGTIVMGGFDCSNTQITSLKGAPDQVGGGFYCSNTKIRSLEGAPSYVAAGFYCSNTNLTSLKGAPDHVGADFNCNNTKIKSLEGSPTYVGSNFYCYHTKILSLHNVHKQIKHIGNKLILSNTIKSNVMGVMFIKELQKIIFTDADMNQRHVAFIINKHIEGGRDVHACQEELIEAGYGDYARL